MLKRIRKYAEVRDRVRRGFLLVCNKNGLKPWDCKDCGSICDTKQMYLDELAGQMNHKTNIKM